MVNWLPVKMAAHFTRTAMISGSGMLNANAVFHDEDGAGTNIHYFGGIIDEVIVYNSAFDAADFAPYAAQVVSVEPKDKFTTTWASIKAERTRQ